MSRLDQSLHLPALPESLYPPRLEQTVIIEWQPFQEFASRYKPAKKAGRRLTAIASPSRRTLTIAGCAIVLFGVGLSNWRVRSVLAAPAVAVRDRIERRATLVMRDDFRMNLALWQTSGASWVRDREGFVRPAGLGIYRPSMPLADYRFEFLALIENKSLGWVFRAQDARNYYAMKFNVLEPGPRPLVALVRYPVIGGRREEGVQSHIPFVFHNNVPYRIQIEVRGNRFTTLFEGQVVDEWVDSRLPAGGVGFFTESGEAARLYWMRISRNTDFVGRLCALLAQSNAPGGSGQTPAGARLPGWGEMQADLARSRRWMDRFLGK